MQNKDQMNLQQQMMQQFMNIQNMQMKQMMMLNQGNNNSNMPQAPPIFPGQMQMPAAEPVCDLKMQQTSPRFSKFISFLASLKQSPLQCAPSICMECWLIIAKEEVGEHRSRHPKQVTPSFQEMKLASRNDIVDLCTKHGRVNGSKLEVFDCSQKVKAALTKVQKWNDGTFNYLEDPQAKAAQQAVMK